MKHLYISATIPEKQAVLNTVFNGLLYYKDGLYRTTYLMELFSHSELMLKEKRLLEIDNNENTGLKARYCGGYRARTGHL